jgi:trehalose-phosphatase
VFECWSPIAERLRAAPVVALFLDFDGTLAPLHPKPEEASIDGAARQALATLAQDGRFKVWIVSGRRRDDVRAKVRLPSACYLGLHGWESRSGAAVREETRRALECLTAWASASIANNSAITSNSAGDGVWIEPKEHILAIHYAGISEDDSSRLRRILERMTEPFADLFRLQAGKRVWEIVPRELGDKGRAVTRTLAALPPGTLAVCLGDDQSDESAFAALPRGITVCVGDAHPSRARYRLAGVPQVRTFLHRLATEFA